MKEPSNDDVTRYIAESGGFLLAMLIAGVDFHPDNRTEVVRLEAEARRLLALRPRCNAWRGSFRERCTLPAGHTGECDSPDLGLGDTAAPRTRDYDPGPIGPECFGGSDFPDDGGAP